MKFKRLLSCLASLASLLSLPAAELIIEDDFYGPIAGRDSWDEGWARQGNYLGGWETGRAQFVWEFAGLDPVRGENFFSGYRGSSEDFDDITQVGIKRFFPEHQWQEGTYILRIHVGAGEGWIFNPPSVLLMAETTGDGEYAWGKRVDGRRIVTTASPAPGEWVEWEIQWEVDATTRNAGSGDTLDPGGDPILGSEMGVLVIRTLAPDEGYAVDALSIHFTPAGDGAEP